MSQQRVRIAPASASHGRSTVAKASGDIKPSDANQKQSHRSKSKIPNSLRYDLENALVGLCDVWFEDIKPHLVRNNIKVHIHGAGSDGDKQACGAPNCSHLDPGAAPDRRRRQTVSYADCCSTQPTAFKARCPKPLPPPCHSVLPAENHHSSRNQSSCRSCKRKTRCKRGHRQAKTALIEGLRRGQVPRLCRTYSLVTPPTPRPQPRSRPTSELHPQKPVTINPKRKHETKDMWTQTTVRRSQVKKIKPPSAKLLSCQSYVIDDDDGFRKQQGNKAPSIDQTKVTNDCAGSSKDCQEASNLAVRKQQRNRKSIPHVSEFNQQDLRPRKLKAKQVNSSTSHGLPTSATHPRRGKRNLHSTPLFQDDLIDIIAEKYDNDRQLKVLFQSPRIEDSSTLSLKPIAITQAKRTPWR